MSMIQAIFQNYGHQYLEKYGKRMPQIHKKAIHDIMNCRGGSFGSLVYQCNDCDSTRFIPCCCGNRHCPVCQHDKMDHWLHKQMKKLLPTHYFLLTITLPEGLQRIARSHQKVMYAALFSCTHDALKKLAKDKRFIGSGRIGYLAVLHTWGSMLQYHPHLHLIVPGGALSEGNDRWLPSRQDLFVHTKPLAVIFKAKFRDFMRKANLIDQADPHVWEQQWVIDSQPVGGGQTSLRYLSRYVFRVAVSNNRIKSIDNQVIRFTYKDRQRNTWKTMSLDAMEFMRRFLQHVLPRGFMKVRHYGFLNPNSASSVETIQNLILLTREAIEEIVTVVPVVKKPGIKCECCGKALTFIAYLIPRSRWGPVV